MADRGPSYILSRLFIAIPELQVDQALMSLLFKQGLVTNDQLQMARTISSRSKKYAELAARMRGKTVVERIMLVAPEIMSSATIDALRRWDLISPVLGNALRVGLSAGKVIQPGAVDEATALARWAALGSSLWSNNTINLLRDLDNLRIAKLREQMLAPGSERLDSEDAKVIQALLAQSIARGQALRSIVSTGRLAADILAKASNMNNVWGIMTLVFEGILSDTLLKNAIRAGVLSQERYELIRALEKLGLANWRKLTAGFDQEAWQVRALLISEGILSPEMITALRVAGVITPELALWLYPAARGIRAITRGQMGRYQKGIRARVVPGEAPITSFARITQATDRQILALLSEAARDARRDAERLAGSGKFGKLTRAQQQHLVERALHRNMRALWENIGHLVIFGEKEAMLAALEAEDFLEGRIWKGSGAKGRDYRRTIRASAENGINSYISRRENMFDLSRRVYKNHALARDLVSREVDKALLRGLNAREMADNIGRLIRPGVRGGVSYNAMRLSRTEINNAFHFSHIRYTREMPWVEGYQWHISGSHGRPDICNTMAQANHDGIGRGVYKKGNVPGKPHPHCLCYITTVTTPPGKFERQLRNGSYDRYLSEVNKAGAMGESREWYRDYDEQVKSTAREAAGALLVRGAGILGSVAGNAAIAAVLP